MQRGLVLWANAFVGAYALDAAFSLGEEFFRAATGSPLLMLPRNALALLVFAQALLCLPALLLTPRLPLRLLLPLALSALWLNTGAAPLPLLFEASALGLAGGAIQGACAAAAFLEIGRRNGGRGWWLDEASLSGPAFSFRHSLLVAAGSVLLLAPASLAYGLVLVATWLQLGTGGFVSFDWSGISLSDRLYTHEGREVRLVGMMHIGEGEAYRELASSFAREDTVVLTEGITDDASVLAEPLSYDRAARLLGLEPQEDVRAYLAEENGGALPEWPVVRHADLDLADFAPETIEWLNSAGRVWDADDPVAELLRFARRASQGGAEWEVVRRDIFDRRNEHLLAQLTRALEEYPRVVVPWGALHLPFVEAAVLEQGFDEIRRESRRLVSWLTIAAALL